MDPRLRRELTRWGAPAAFLAAVTVAVLLVKAGLTGGGGQTTTMVQPPTRAPTSARTTTKIVLTQPPATTAAASPAEGEFYVIESGDTLGSIALEHDTTVEELARLNPDVDPTALRVGDRIRVG